MWRLSSGRAGAIDPSDQGLARLTYDFTITNTGNITLTDVAVIGTVDPPVGPLATAGWQQPAVRPLA